MENGDGHSSKYTGTKHKVPRRATERSKSMNK